MRREITGRCIGFGKGCTQGLRGAAYEWPRKLFTKFPDSGVGCPVKMQTPQLIPRLIEVCDYCRGGIVSARLANVVFAPSPDERDSSISLSLAVFFSIVLFPDENVMSEVEIAAATARDTPKVRIESA